MPAQSLFRTNNIYVAPDYSGFPELYLTVAFVGDDEDIPDYAQWLIRCSCQLTDDLNKADMVIFGGGADVDPQLYGQRSHSSTSFDALRDEEEILIYEECRAKGIPILGVCRGAQLSHVMEDGLLYQDVDNHNNGSHKAYSPTTKQFLPNISSVHHQAVQPREDDRMEVILKSWEASYRQKTPLDRVNARGKVNGKTEADIEGFFYRDALVLGIQGHPEYPGFDDFARWTSQAIDHYFCCNPDTAYIDKVLRKKPELIVPLKPFSAAVAGVEALKQKGK